MAKLLAVSVLIVPLLMARQAAGLRDPRKGIRTALWLTIAFNSVYVLALIYVFFRLS